MSLSPHLFIVQDLDGRLAPLCLLQQRLSLWVIRIIGSRDTRRHCSLF